ncbi:MAG: O-antigen ligase family protein [Gammaproteobacteria bacterium]|nr:O-antigen ligase family protein [Gammaproteobacteria bacterium]
MVEIRKNASYLVVVALSVLCGLSLAVGVYFVSISLIAISFILVLYMALMSNRNESLRDGVFWVFLISLLLTSNIQKTLGISVFFFLEFILLVISPFLIANYYRCVNESSFLRHWTYIIVVFIVLSLISSVFGRSTFMASIYQFFTNLKIFIVFMLGFYLLWSEKTNRNFMKFVGWFWLPILVFILWQWVFPDSYSEVFSYAKPGFDPMGIFPARALGVFQHPSFLALFAAVCLGFCLAWYVLARMKKFIYLSAIYFLILVASTERQEIIAAVFSLLVTFLVYHRLRYFAVTTIVLLVPILGMLAIYEEQVVEMFDKESVMWGFSGYGEISHPRPVMYIESFNIANEYSPLGSGLGTFGSAGALKYDISMYIERGITSYPWFYDDNVSMDTYWPNFVAETGFVGFILMLVIVLYPTFYSAKRLFSSKRKDESKMWWFLSFFGLTFMLVLSATSPSFQDPGLFFLPGILFGIAFKKDAKQTGGVGVHL